MGRPRAPEKYHLFARPHHTSRNRIWYAWWWENGKRVYRSTGCRLKADALGELEKWRAADDRAAAGSLREYAVHFFTPGRCPYLAWKAEGGGLKPQTVYEHRKNLVKYILEWFGNDPLGAPTEADVETKVRRLAASGSTKNSILNTYRIVMVEAKRAGKIQELPRFRRFARRSMRKDTLSSGECRTLFSDDRVELARIWRASEDDITGYLFGLLFRVILHAGMRPAEGRALTVVQLFPEHNGILIDRQLDSELEEALPKKATPEDPRSRLVLIPETTMSMLTDWIRAEQIEEGPLFLLEGRPIDKDMLRRRFKIGLKNAEVRVGERILSPYSLRYTFRSRTQGTLDAEILRSMMGHRSLEMSDRYLQVEPEQFEALKTRYQKRIDELWG